ncbi:hypothetical protein ACSSVY_004569, partial [Roseovarius sp. MBR-51]
KKGLRLFWGNRKYPFTGAAEAVVGTRDGLGAVLLGRLRDELRR